LAAQGEGLLSFGACRAAPPSLPVARGWASGSFPMKAHPAFWHVCCSEIPMIITTVKLSFLSPFLLLASGALAGYPAASPDDPGCTAQDRIYMARAFELARYAITHGGGPFGALLVKDGKVLAEFSNCVHSTGDVTKHAETGLISAFSPKIDRETFAKCTLYTSTEPCTMCCGAICFAGIGRVVYGTSEAPFLQVMGLPPDKDPLTSHEVFRRISPNTKVLGPLMEAEGLVIHEGYWPIHPEDVGKS
jgi:tRNA(Arg) A34 adenosine deaminase TadA